MNTKYNCDICKWDFTRKIYLSNHLKTNKHITRATTNKDNYHACNCGKKYACKKAYSSIRKYVEEIEKTYLKSTIKLS
jgi:hypothetical protein